jgi:arsenite-transporting ATPase
LTPTNRTSPQSPVPSPCFVFYGGKGGVGKTTSAAAFALGRAAAGDRVLIASTDPAHSLGDALGVSLARTPRTVRRGLDAVELDAPRAFARWLAEHRRPLGEILEHGTWLDREDVDALLGLSIPGVDELMGIIEIERLASPERQARKRRQEDQSPRALRPLRSYDLIVVDTAPTGHTLRLLSAPETVAAVAALLGELQSEHRLIREQLARVGRPEAADRLIALLAAQARATAERLRDPDRTRFVWVTLPEQLSLAETEEAIASLDASGIHVGEILVNRVLPDGGACRICDRRRADERKTLGLIRRRLGRNRDVRVVPAAPHEPRGLKPLASLARAGGHTGPPLPAMATAVGADLRVGPSGHRPLAISHQRSAMKARDASAFFEGASLLFVGGKGGVGKTTVASAIAIRLARADPAKRVLLLSTDPAHSLGDVFGSRVGDAARTIAGAPANLVVRELDAEAALADRRTRLEAALEEIASSTGAESSAIGTEELMRLAPPGIDELFGVLSFVDARVDYDVIVVDTAPTGHALRLLEMPEAAREWTQVLLRVLLKYRSLVRPGQLAAELVDVSKSIRGLIAVLRDAKTTRFIVVTRAAQLPRRETARLLARLRRLGLSAPAVVVNARTLAPGRCARCRAVAAAERREVAALKRACGRRCAIIQTPLIAPPPRGAKALSNLEFVS